VQNRHTNELFLVSYLDHPISWGHNFLHKTPNDTWPELLAICLCKLSVNTKNAQIEVQEGSLRIVRR
jgi:hypothetical protein